MVHGKNLENTTDLASMSWVSCVFQLGVCVMDKRGSRWMVAANTVVTAFSWPHKTIKIGAVGCLALEPCSAARVSWRSCLSSKIWLVDPMQVMTPTHTSYANKCKDVASWKECVGQRFAPSEPLISYAAKPRFFNIEVRCSSGGSG